MTIVLRGGNLIISICVDLFSIVIANLVLHVLNTKLNTNVNCVSDNIPISYYNIYSF